ncbi:hypothetical protein [Paenibacillus sp.]|uniref:hypothetical protein n=1 Tax=Paenibacillus sp. TaxID=58172 RepID=UPI0028B262B7|nr:hypothetical protein [Paenibacillus sp.]
MFEKRPINPIRFIQQMKADIRFENDAKLFALGISRLFPNERYISLTLGTGLGSAFIDRASILNEGPGVPKDGWLYDKPFLESSKDDAFSRRGILRRAEQMGALEEEMDVKELAEHAREGNGLCCKVFEKFVTRLAEASTVLYTSENVFEHTLIGISRLFDSSFGFK